MLAKELLDAAQMAVLYGANPKDIQFHHRESMTIYQGNVVQQMNEIYLNGHQLLAGQRDEVRDDLSVQMLVPFLVTTQFYHSATARDWDALFLVRAIENGRFGESITSLFCEQSDVAKWALAYAYMDRKQIDTMQLFRRILNMFLPEAKIYIRNVSTTSHVQMDWLIHVPNHSQPFAQKFVHLVAQLLLPFYHVTVVIAQEPPALLNHSNGIQIGRARIVDETFESEKQWSIEGVK